VFQKQYTMTVQEIANRLVELCRQNQYEAAQTELYAEDAESVEPAYSQTPYLKGLDAIREKGRYFQSSIEAVHGGYVGDPILAGNHFAVAMGMDITIKGMGRMTMDEIAVYQVKDGKIVKEQFIF
jgi:hypothetical protein